MVGSERSLHERLLEIDRLEKEIAQLESSIKYLKELRANLLTVNEFYHCRFWSAERKCETPPNDHLKKDIVEKRVRDRHHGRSTDYTLKMKCGCVLTGDT